MDDVRVPFQFLSLVLTKKPSTPTYLGAAVYGIARIRFNEAQTRLLRTLPHFAVTVYCRLPKSESKETVE
jgi:hypothetical protein